MPDKTPFDDLVKQFQSEQNMAALASLAGTMAVYFHALLKANLTRLKALQLTIAFQSALWEASIRGQSKPPEKS